MCADELRDLLDFRDAPSAVVVPMRRRRWLVSLLAAAAVLAIIAFFALRPERIAPPTPAQHPSVQATNTVAPPVDTTATTTTVAAHEPEIASALKPVVAALLAHRLPAAALLAQLRPAAGQQRTGDSDPVPPVHLLGPVGAVIDDVRPLFVWRADADTSWRVEVFDASVTRVADSGTIAGTQWRAHQPLMRDATYTWQVSRVGAEGREIFPKPPHPPARFHVISADAHKAIVEAKGVDRALLHAREGMLDDASHELIELARVEPEVPLYRELAAAVDALRDQPAPMTANEPQ
jgi:hypothetical protein